MSRKYTSEGSVNVLIIGAGNAGSSLYDEILRNPKSMFVVRCFIDDDKLKIGHFIHGVPVKGPIESVSEIIKQYPIDEIFIAAPSMPEQRRQEVVKLCAGTGIKTKIMPDTLLVIEQNGVNYVKSLRDVKVEDLLERNVVSFTEEETKELLTDKTILITGGGGSIGSELCRQVAKHGVKKLIVFDVYENDSYMLFLELKMNFPELAVVIEIGTIVDEKRVKEIFDKYSPDVVFHAAAHKHVPLMEISPYEAIQNNIFGTRNVILETYRHKCKKFVLISTDKAVNPTNVMGATKRYCELMVRAVINYTDCVTDFVTVRFGNVLGSHGSVVPIFQMQIAAGGPVTITDKRITRYFMTIPEAAGLVIKAAAIASRSETYILDMGKPVKIIEMAENLIKLSGYEPYKEIIIKETGLRPGEKLYEELLVDDEKHTATTIPKLNIEKDRSIISESYLTEKIEILKRELENGDKAAIVEKLREFVPTFKTPEEVNSRATEAKILGN